MNKLDPAEHTKREYLLLLSRVTSALSDLLIKARRWEEAEKICIETIGLMQKCFEDQPESLHSNLAIQEYQIAVVRKNLKKFDEALESVVRAYEHATESKLKLDFMSAVARQRADILDALDRVEDAKAVMKDHLERMEALV